MPTETTLDGLRDIRVYQNKNGYRFSVDALLLYSFVNVRYAKRIIDLGTGSGIIGMLLAKKYPQALAVLVELQESLYRLAVKNVDLNSLHERVSVLHSDIAHLRGALEAESFDLAVSNPPFRKPASGRLSVGQEKAVARHELSLTLPALAEAVSYLLKSKGRFFMIFHPERLFEVADVLRQNRLEPKRIRFVYNDITSVSKIVLIEAIKDGKSGMKIDKSLFLYESEGVYTEELREMYGKETPATP